MTRKPVKIVLRIRQDAHRILEQCPTGTIFLWKNLYCMKTNMRAQETPPPDSDSIERRIYIVNIKTGHMYLSSPGYEIPTRDFLGGLE